MAAGRRVARGLAIGLVSGLAAGVVTELVRPRGGAAEMLDWDQVLERARARVPGEPLSPGRRAELAGWYRALAAEVTPPLLEVVGGLPAGAHIPEFEALDRAGWLELNVGLMRQVLDPLTGAARVPRSLLTDLGRAATNRWVAGVLGFLATRVLGQFDPQLLGREPVQHSLYLVEPNVAAWEQAEGLAGEELRRWLILHELTHAWQFAAHPWLRDHLNGELERVIARAVAGEGRGGLERLLALTVGARGQWASLRRLQATMTLVEGYGNLAMNLAGRRILPGFERLEAAYRRRSGRRSPLELLVMRLTGLEMKMRQYRVGEAFAQAVHDRHGMEVLNRAWEGPETLPRLEELRDPERWCRRVAGGAAPAWGARQPAPGP